MRFAQVQQQLPATSTVSFGGQGAAAQQSNPEIDEINSEFEGQIEEIKKNIKAVRAAMKESEECARQLREQKVQERTLEEQLEHLEKQREKQILEAKLRKQMHDLQEINRMSRSLRAKFDELKRTQNMIKARMSGTRSSLNQLDNEPGNYCSAQLSYLVVSVCG